MFFDPPTMMIKMGVVMTAITLSKVMVQPQSAKLRNAPFHQALFQKSLNAILYTSKVSVKDGNTRIGHQQANTNNMLNSVRVLVPASTAACNVA
jgi:hypothetical protein